MAYHNVTIVWNLIIAYMDLRVVEAVIKDRYNNYNICEM